MTLWACVLETERPNAALMRSLALARLVVFASSVTSGAEDLGLSDLDVAGWECLDRAEGTAKTQDAIERNRMKNRSPENQIAGLIESLDTAAFLKKIGAYGACEGIRIQSLAGFFRLHDKRFPSDRTQGAESPRDWLSYVGRRPQRQRGRGFDHRVFRHQRISSSVALDGVGDSPDNETRGGGVKSQPMNSPDDTTSRVSRSHLGGEMARHPSRSSDSLRKKLSTYKTY